MYSVGYVVAATAHVVFIAILHIHYRLTATEWFNSLDVTESADELSRGRKIPLDIDMQSEDRDSTAIVST